MRVGATQDTTHRHRSRHPTKRSTTTLSPPVPVPKPGRPTGLRQPLGVACDAHPICHTRTHLHTHAWQRQHDVLGAERVRRSLLRRDHMHSAPLAAGLALGLAAQLDKASGGATNTAVRDGSRPPHKVTRQGVLLVLQVHVRKHAMWVIWGRQRQQL